MLSFFIDQGRSYFKFCALKSQFSTTWNWLQAKSGLALVLNHIRNPNGRAPIGATGVLPPEHAHRAAPRVLPRDRASGERAAGSSAIACPAEELLCCSPKSYCAARQRAIVLLAKELKDARNSGGYHFPQIFTLSSQVGEETLFDRQKQVPHN